MNEGEIIFKDIASTLEHEFENIEQGKMMSSPGIKYKNKVFAFYYKEHMVFRLGKNFEPLSLSIVNYSLLDPFKNKPPMAGWFQIPFIEKDKWEVLSRLAMNTLKNEIDT